MRTFLRWVAGLLLLLSTPGLAQTTLFEEHYVSQVTPGVYRTFFMEGIEVAYHTISPGNTPSQPYGVVMVGTSERFTTSYLGYHYPGMLWMTDLAGTLTLDLTFHDFHPKEVQPMSNGEMVVLGGKIYFNTVHLGSYSPTGSVAWEKRITGPFTDDDRITMDGQGDVVVASGTPISSALGELHLSVFNATSGNLMQSNRYPVQFGGQPYNGSLEVLQVKYYDQHFVVVGAAHDTLSTKSTTQATPEPFVALFDSNLDLMYLHKLTFAEGHSFFTDVTYVGNELYAVGPFTPTGGEPCSKNALLFAQLDFNSGQPNHVKHYCFDTAVIDTRMEITTDGAELLVTTVIGSEILGLHLDDQGTVLNHNNMTPSDYFAASEVAYIHDSPSPGVLTGGTFASYLATALIKTPVDFSHCGAQQENILISELQPQVIDLWANKASQEVSVVDEPLLTAQSIAQIAECSSVPRAEPHGGASLPESPDDWELYPNPAAGPIALRLPARAEPTTVRVYTLTGALVQSHQLAEGVKEHTLTALPAGTYYVRVVQGSESSGKLLRIE